MDWIETFKALLTPTIALFAGYIAWQQWRTNRNRLKLDLFDRRYAIYAAARNLIGHVFRHGNFTDLVLFEFVTATRESEFLLNKSVADYLDEFYRNGIELMNLNINFEHLDSLDDRKQNLEQQHAIRNWFNEQRDQLMIAFRKFLKFEHWRT
jgi:hypothetical protein